MFDQLIRDVASRFNVGTPAITSVLRGILSMMTNERTGGINGFIDSFRRAGLGDAVASWIGIGKGHTLTEPQIESAIGRDTIGDLADTAGLTRGIIGPALAYLVPKLIDLITPNGELPTTEELQTQVSGFMRSTSEPIVTHAQREEVAAVRDGGSMSWLPWVAIPVLALIAWFFLRTPGGAGTMDPVLAVNNEGGEVTYTGQVRDESARSTIVEALNSTFGESNVSGNVSVDENVKEADWIPQVDELVSALNTPGTEFTLTGDSASVGGWLSESERQNVTEEIRGVLGSGIAVGALGDRATEAVSSANERATEALSQLDATNVDVEQLVDAINMTVINFESGSAEIPAGAQTIIEASAEAIQRAPEGTQIIIEGHTDNTGDPAANMSLSEERAQAVLDALIEAGVDESMLTAEGRGGTEPIAPNDTERGRFENRRIEYSVPGSEGEGTAQTQQME